jgi:hypothetical protein
MSKQDNLERAATKLLNDLSKFDQLRELGNRKHYPSKLKKLDEKITSELELWERKGPSARLSDLRKDAAFIKKQKEEPIFDKERIDLLTNKYSISYGEDRHTK